MRYCTGFLNHVFIIIVFLRIKVVLKNNGYISENYSVSNGFFSNKSINDILINEYLTRFAKLTRKILYWIIWKFTMLLLDLLKWGWTGTYIGDIGLYSVWCQYDLHACIWINNLKQHKNCFGSKLLLNALGTVNWKWGQVRLRSTSQI